MEHANALESHMKVIAPLMTQAAFSFKHLVLLEYKTFILPQTNSNNSQK